MRKTAIRKVSKNPIRRAELAADALFQKVVVGLWKKCAKCGSAVGLAAHHIKSRRHKLWRHSVYNGICLCNVCHIDWAHSVSDDLFMNWFSSAFPAVWRAHVSSTSLYPVAKYDRDWIEKQVQLLKFAEHVGGSV
jgi:hypothetical protein